MKWITSPPCFNNAVTLDCTYMDPGTRDCRIRTGCAVQSLIDAAVMLPAEHEDLKTAVKVPGTNFCSSSTHRTQIAVQPGQGFLDQLVSGNVMICVI